ncbi:hypothetical protein PCANC_22618 [Puccinia coronata f. sp. avenae]|uniref:BRCT domain-containing protein n=1 Tax=Puccinia coronata f. sp. avenae TaxID=200324 RepID=A0A2N5S5N8_9BASI|nr:hypothetical protein PCANC_22618 [Puccinia coronata f. sp. avenae]
MGHKRGGTKVSGAKLKPAIPTPIPAAPLAVGKGGSKKGKQKETRISTREAHEEEEEEEDQYDRTFMESIRKDRPPLTGCIICLSGISEPIYSQAIAYAEKLGARIEKALTMHTTHLICDRPGSEKYNVALNHSIRIMLPLWLETLYSSFTEGEDIDLDDITRRYTMKPLHTLKLAITGKASSSRTPFIQLAEDNGATVSIDLEIDCSHLIVLSLVPPKETDPAIFEIQKVQAARKSKKIKVVWQEWLEDSVQRQGSLPEGPYLVQENVPRPGRLVLPDSESAHDATIDQKELVRAMQGDKNFETAVTRKNINSASQNAIMASIILQQDLPIRRHPSNLSFKSADAERHRKKLEEELPQIFHHNKTAASSSQLPCSNASANASSVFHPLLKDFSKNSEPASLVKRLRSVKSTKFGNPALPPNEAEVNSHRIVPGLFRGLKISTVGCIANHQRKIAALVAQCGGQFTEIHSSADYTVVPLLNPPCIPPGCNPVGHHWVEQSLYERQIIDPDKHWSGRPVRLGPFPNPEQYTFSACGFTSVEEHIIQQVVKKMELKYIEHPRRSEVSHFFIGPVQGSSRVDKVKSWSDKLQVDFEWLVRMCNGTRISRSTPPAPPSRATGSPPPEPIYHQHQDSTTDLDIHHTPLSQCVVFLTRKGSLHPTSKCLIDCCKLGATVVNKLNESVTHVVHAADRPHDPLKELKWARSRNLHIVHPHWLLECKTKLIKADELAFPATFNPQRALTYCALSSTEITMADVTSNSIPEEVNITHEVQEHESSEVILEPDETFYMSPHSRAPVVAPIVADDAPHALNFDQISQQIEQMAESDEPQCPQPTSPHAATSPRSNIFPTSPPSSHRLIPGVDTQLGGFMEILQQRNNGLIDLSGKAKEKDTRKSRKRGLDESTRGSGNHSAADDSHRSAPIGNGLHRTMSEFSHSSTTPSQAGGFLDQNAFQESMDVTWEDPAAKREILKAIYDAPSKTTSTRKTITRRLPDPKTSSVDSPASNLCHAHREPARGGDANDRTHAKKSSRPDSKKRSELIPPDEPENRRMEVNVDDDDDDDDELVFLPPMKKRRPRLVDK